MERSPNQRLKLLYLAQILTERTDEDTYLTEKELENALAAYGISASRQTIYKDMDALRLFGMDILMRRGRENGYALCSRDFELPELKLLIDAVQSSKFITGKKSDELIKKLYKLTSVPQAKNLRRNVYVAGRAKSFNENVYYSVDAIHAAINAGRKISFQYFDYNVRKRRVFRKGGEVYIRTPVALCWSDDNYYLITYSPKYSDHFAHFRVDRMMDVRTLEDVADEWGRRDFNIAEYSKRLFGMYSGVVVRAELAFDNSLVNTVLGHFGKDTRLTAIDENRFSVDVEVSESPAFLAWLFQFGKRAEIIAPDNLRRTMRELIDKTREMYSQ
jgi:predicted DNA-binding transcriptional regulator YafY